MAITIIAAIDIIATIVSIATIATIAIIVTIVTIVIIAAIVPILFAYYERKYKTDYFCYAIHIWGISIFQCRW